MKKILAGILAVVLCLGLVGCTSNEPVLGAVLSDGKIVKLGDSREDAEKILGEPGEESPIKQVPYEKDHVSIFYRDGIVCGIVLYEAGANFMGIQVGDTLEEAQKVIQNKSISENGDISCKVQMTDNGLQYLTEEEWKEIAKSSTDEERKNYYVINISSNESNIVDFISITDALYMKLK